MTMEITYTRQGDYLLPNLTLPEQDNRPIGLWGQQHLRYIKRSRPILYTNLLTKCRLNEYLADIDEQAQKMYDELVQAFAKEEGCTEQLRATNQMLWVRKNCRNAALSIRGNPNVTCASGNARVGSSHDNVDNLPAQGG